MKHIEFCAFLFQLFQNYFYSASFLFFVIIFQTLGFFPKTYNFTILLIWLLYPPSLHRQQL